jgi:dicarboxylate transporter 10
MYRICREEGPRVLLRGLGPSTQRAVLITVSQMTSYDVFKMALVQRLGWYEDGMITHFSASLLAVSVCKLISVDIGFSFLTHTLSFLTH